MKHYSRLLLQKKDFIKGTSPNFLLIYYNLPFVYANTFSCQLRMCIFSLSPSMRISLLSKQYYFFNLKSSLHPEVHCLTVFLQGHCRRINMLQIHSYTFRCCSGINVMAKKIWSIHEFKYFSYKLCKYND